MGTGFLSFLSSEGLETLSEFLLDHWATSVHPCRRPLIYEIHPNTTVSL